GPDHGLSAKVAVRRDLLEAGIQVLAGFLALCPVFRGRDDPSLVLIQSQLGLAGQGRRADTQGEEAKRELLFHLQGSNAQLPHRNWRVAYNSASGRGQYPPANFPRAWYTSHVVNKVTASHSIFIAASPEAVWEYTQDWSRRHEWDPTVSGARISSEDPRIVD